MTKNAWPLIALAVLGAIAAVFSLAAFDWVAWTCSTPSSEPSKPFALGPGGCFEFWLNRYQSLLGALAAVGAAWYAGNWVRRQILLGRQQVAAAMLPIAEEGMDRVERLVAILAAYNNDILDNSIDLKIIIENFQAACAFEDESARVAIIAQQDAARTRIRERLQRFIDRNEEFDNFIGLGRMHPEHRYFIQKHFTTAHLDAQMQKSVLDTFESFIGERDIRVVEAGISAIGSDDEIEMRIVGKRIYDPEGINKVISDVCARIDKIRANAGFA